MTLSDKHEAAIPPEEDKLGRLDEVNAAVRFLKSLRKPTVINVSAPWGAGKSFFLRMVEHQLKVENIPVIYHDAWTHDFNDDPFVGLLADFKQALGGVNEDAQKKFMKKAGALALTVLAGAAKQAAKKALGDGIENEVLEAAAQGSSDAVLGNIETGIKAHSQVDGARKAFNEALLHARDSLSDSKKLVVLIDELDRCRPEFSVRMLEALKHSFWKDGVRSCIATFSANTG